MNSRDEILARVRSAVGDRPTEPAVIERGYRTHAGHAAGHPALVELFVDRLVDYRAQVHRCAGDGIADVVATIVAATVAPAAGLAAARVAVPDGVPRAWLPTTLEAVSGEVPVAELEALDAVFTGATVAIAETGTIVLDAAPNQGRRINTLLPDVHICVVREEQVVGTVPEALTRLAPTRPQTWISGPSATSDIELDRVEGVHGPRTLHVVIVGARPG